MAEKKPAEERLFTVPLRREWLKARKNRRARRSITTIRSHLSRHMKVPETDIRVSSKLNETIWLRGAAKPPAKVRLKASLDSSTGMLHALLPDEKPPEPKKEKPEKGAKPEEAAKLTEAARAAADRLTKAAGGEKPKETERPEKQEKPEASKPEKPGPEPGKPDEKQKETAPAKK